MEKKKKEERGGSVRLTETAFAASRHDNRQGPKKQKRSGKNQNNMVTNHRRIGGRGETLVGIYGNGGFVLGRCNLDQYI